MIVPLVADAPAAEVLVLLPAHVLGEEDGGRFVAAVEKGVLAVGEKSDPGDVALGHGQTEGIAVVADVAEDAMEV